jgi:hypothetical protein
MNSQISPLKHFCRRPSLWLSFFLLSISICKAQNNSASVISYPQALPKEVVVDIQSLVQASTGQRWDTTQRPSNKGLVLSVKTSGDYKTGESCLISSRIKYVKI